MDTGQGTNQELRSASCISTVPPTALSQRGRSTSCIDAGLENGAPIKQEPWFRFPQYLIPQLPKFKSYGPLAVYLALLSHDNPRHNCFPGIAKLAEETGLTPRGVQKALQHLKRIGVLSIRYRKRFTNKYLIKSALTPLKGKGHILH